MILKASQRGGGSRLAAHLMNIADNDHITVHEVRGFVAQDLRGAFNEADAIARGTRCKKYLFSMSFNPPGRENVSTAKFIDAIDRAEKRLGLTDQPRVIVFHEKNGRRHAHAVWSRIDASEMKAVNMPFFKNRLHSLSKELFLENGWELPRGYRENDWKNALNFTVAEFQQADRLGLDPREVKQIFNQAFEQSDSFKAFRAALEDSGYYVARGDRRGMVALDLHGKVYSVPRWCGIKTKTLRAKFPDTGKLPSVDQTKSMIGDKLMRNMHSYMKDMRRDQQYQAHPLNVERKELIDQQRQQRQALNRQIDKRKLLESKRRHARYRSGLGGVYDLLTGKRRTIRKENETHLKKCDVRDQSQRDALVKRQLQERQILQARIETLRKSMRDERRRLIVRMADVLAIKREMSNTPQRGRERGMDYGI